MIYATKRQLDSVNNKIKNKQEKLIAGENITIDAETNTISSVGGGSITAKRDTKSAGYKGTPLPTTLTTTDVYINNKLSPEEVVNLCNKLIEDGILPEVESQIYAGYLFATADETIAYQIMIMPEGGVTYYAIGNGEIRPEYGGSPTFIYPKLESLASFEGWNPNDTYEFKNIQPQGIGETGFRPLTEQEVQAFAPILSTTPFEPLPREELDTATLFDKEDRVIYPHTTVDSIINNDGSKWEIPEQDNTIFLVVPDTAVQDDVAILTSDMCTEPLENLIKCKKFLKLIWRADGSETIETLKNSGNFFMFNPGTSVQLFDNNPIIEYTQISDFTDSIISKYLYISQEDGTGNFKIQLTEKQLEGTQVVANNNEPTTEELKTLKVGETNYSMPAGGGGISIDWNKPITSTKGDFGAWNLEKPLVAGKMYLLEVIQYFSSGQPATYVSTSLFVVPKTINSDGMFFARAVQEKVTSVQIYSSLQAITFGEETLKSPITSVKVYPIL